jgi:hypothetical protein
MLTFGPHADVKKTINIGIAEHITAASEGVSRFNSQLSSADRQAIENGIWLGKTRSKLIDSVLQQYMTARLQTWRLYAEREARVRLNKQLGLTARRRRTTLTPPEQRSPTIAGAH